MDPAPVLASRPRRALAKLVDVATLGGVYFGCGTLAARWGGPTGGDPDAAPIAALLGAGVLLLLQATLLTFAGQTLGKGLFRIRIISAFGGRLGFTRVVMLRHAMPWILHAATWGISLLLAPVDVLMICGNNRRCGHDLLAATIVVVK